MALCRLIQDDGHARWAVHDGAHARPLPPGTTLRGLLGGGLDGLRAALASVADDAPIDGALAPPIDPDTEIWAAGVTYEASREAREHESALPDVYRRVYDADRPELFLKTIGWRAVGPHASIGVRADSTWDVPEAEVALVIAPDGTVAGFTVCNDVSSRSIEGDNPLYLPQAKTYRNSCALGPWIVPAWDVPDPYALGIEVAIRRTGEVVWSDATSTATLHRRYDDLVSWLRRELDFPHGVVLSTGTSLIPPEGVTLEDGDEVTITIDGIGTLRNPVVRGGRPTG